MTMAPQLLFLFITTILTQGVFCEITSKDSLMAYPFACSQNTISTCDAYLYHISRGLKIEDILSYYKVNSSQISTISHKTNKDYLISVPCSCQNVDSTTGYFYSSVYTVKKGDNTFTNMSNQIYSGQAWNESEEGSLHTGQEIPIHLLCGCLGGNSKVVTYTVQDGDTLIDIANLLSSSLDEIQRLNERTRENPSFIEVGWVFFVPMETDGAKGDAVNEGKKSKKPIIIGIVTSVAFVVAGLVLVILYRQNQSRQNLIEDPQVVNKSLSAKDIASLQKNQYLRKESIEDVTAFESEKPLIYSLVEIEEATLKFDETRKIGEGGYGSVYYGMLGEQVDLIGYASGDDHLYLVYEYVQNGSLNDHLHDPLIKGHQPLSWNARAQIALDAARGIEYIHDHTKARYVHRDIKTSNILLDEGLRAKVADFGLAKLLERSSEEDFIATRLVGTPGYLPPESVRELHMTSKCDVFAFGVVLAELITGQRALIRDHREPNKMKSLISIVYSIFEEEAPENGLEAFIDGNLKGSYPLEEVFKMAQIAEWCLNEDAVNRPEMREVVVKLSQILMSSVEWEASLGGNSQVFSGLFNGR
ncbi:hypothetical protein MRB53_031624 [Persea americana]|uniref:Uncharacterized protein n=1 Tax=Persea americana TaxID=3435 RepID=A0ACC2KQ05_PERAE|nr:hypothetical protein MRB53_031624 [Persea americana]